MRLRPSADAKFRITELPTPALSEGPRSVTLPSPSSSEPTVVQEVPLVTPVGAAKPSIRPAFRVALTIDAQSPGKWSVRALTESEVVPPGCEEALLIALDPKTRLVQ